MKFLITVSLIAVGMITPANVAQAREAGEIIIPRTVEGSGNMPQAVFSHAVHRIQFKCYVCHDSLFKMQAGADHIDMDGVREGRFCGVCHDGEKAFAVGFDTCNRCHRKALP